MPQGNAHTIPPGLWFQEPKTSSIPKLLLGTAARYSILLVGCGIFMGLRYMSYTYTYTNFIGKTSLGKLTVLDHEPLSTEEIDLLKKRQKGLN